VLSLIDAYGGSFCISVATLKFTEAIKEISDQSA
jgi:hypothetical protein